MQRLLLAVERRGLGRRRPRASRRMARAAASTRRRASARSRPSTAQVAVNAGGLWYKIVLAGDKVSLTFIDAPAQPKLPDGALPDGQRRHRQARHRPRLARRADHALRPRHPRRQDRGRQPGDRNPRRQTPDRAAQGRRRVRGSRAAPRRSRRRRPRRDRRGEILSQARLGAGGHRRAPRQIRDRRRDAAARRSRIAGSIPPASPTSPATAKPTSRWCASRTSSARSNCGAGATAPCARSPNFPTSPITSPARARSTWRRWPISTATASPISPRPRSTAAACASSASRRSPREIANVPLPAKAVTNLGLVAESSGPPAIAVGLADGSLAVIRRAP